MSVGEFTVSNIAADEDKKEEKAKKGQSKVDMDKLRQDIDVQREAAKQVHTACS